MGLALELILLSLSFAVQTVLWSMIGRFGSLLRIGVQLSPVLFCPRILLICGAPHERVLNAAVGVSWSRG